MLDENKGYFFNHNRPRFKDKNKFYNFTPKTLNLSKWFFVGFATKFVEKNM